MSALLPCPWCGRRPTVFGPAPGHGIAIECANAECAAEPSVMNETKEGAVAAWNRRTPPPLPTREALAAALAVIPTGLRNQAMHLPPAMAEAAADAVLRLLGGERDNG